MNKTITPIIGEELADFLYDVLEENIRTKEQI